MLEHVSILFHEERKMDKQQFNAAFAAFLDTIRDAESITKRELGAMSVTLIKGIHGLGDAQLLIGELDYINRLLPVLTGWHRRLMVTFFKHFGGYTYDDKLGVFTKKNKAQYMVALDQAKQLLAGKGVYLDGQALITPEMDHNVWGWSEHLKIEHPKVFNPEKVAKFVKAQVALATGGGLSKLDVLAAVFDGGFTGKDAADLMERIAAAKEAAGAIDKAMGQAPLPEARR